MSCVDGVAASLDDFMAKTRAAETVIVVDGCDNECGRRIMEERGFGNIIKYVRVIDLGIENVKPKRAEETEIATVREHVASLL